MQPLCVLVCYAQKKVGTNVKYTCPYQNESLSSKNGDKNADLDEEKKERKEKQSSASVSLFLLQKLSWFSTLAINHPTKDLLLRRREGKSFPWDDIRGKQHHSHSRNNVRRNSVVSTSDLRSHPTPQNHVVATRMCHLSHHNTQQYVGGRWRCTFSHLILLHLCARSMKEDANNLHWERFFGYLSPPATSCQIFTFAF